MQQCGLSGSRGADQRDPSGGGQCEAHLAYRRHCCLAGAVSAAEPDALDHDARCARIRCGAWAVSGHGRTRPSSRVITRVAAPRHRGAVAGDDDRGAAPGGIGEQVEDCGFGDAVEFAGGFVGK